MNLLNLECFFSIDNGAMNALRYWQQRNERSAILATEPVRDGADSLKGLSQDGGRAEFYKNLRAFLFNKYGTYLMNLISAGSILLVRTYSTFRL